MPAADMMPRLTKVSSASAKTIGAAECWSAEVYVKEHHAGPKHDNQLHQRLYQRA